MILLVRFPYIFDHSLHYCFVNNITTLNKKMAAWFLGSHVSKNQTEYFIIQLLTIITVTDCFVNPSKIYFLLLNSN